MAGTGTDTGEGRDGSAVYQADHTPPIANRYLSGGTGASAGRPGGGEDAASLPVLGGVRRPEQPWQERGIALRRRKRVAPGLASRVEADVVGGGMEAARDVAEEIQREVRPWPPDRVVVR